MAEPVRVGVVGAGAIAQVAHLVALSKLPDVALVGICDIDVPKAQALARRFHITDVHDDIEDLLRYSAPDAVVICTPNHLHEIHTITALSAGVHVLCERPLALSPAGVERVRQVWAESDRVLLVGMNHRYRRDVRTVREFLEGRELGALHSIRAGWYIFRPTGTPAGWRERRRESGGGVMLDLGLPLVDLALWLTGCPAVRRVSAAYAVRTGAQVEDSAAAFLICERNLSIFVDVSWRHVGPSEKFWFELMGEVGSAQIGRFSVFKELHGAPVNVTPPDVGQGDPFGDSYREEWVYFLRAVRGEVERPGLEEYAALHRVIDAVQRAAAEGHDVAL